MMEETLIEDSLGLKFEYRFGMFLERTLRINITFRLEKQDLH